MESCKAKGTALHLMGLLSPGGVHSHMEHLFGIVKMAKANGLDKVYIHAFLDGRDVPPSSAAAIEQIKSKNYTEKLSQYTGEILLVCINYDDKKGHSCSIEKIIKD